MLLKVLSCTGQPPTKNDVAPMSGLPQFKLCPGPLTCLHHLTCLYHLPSSRQEPHLPSWVSLPSEGGAMTNFSWGEGRATFRLGIYLLRFLSSPNFGVGGVAAGLCLASYLPWGQGRLKQWVLSQEREVGSVPQGEVRNGLLRL